MTDLPLLTVTVTIEHETSPRGHCVDVIPVESKGVPQLGYSGQMYSSQQLIPTLKKMTASDYKQQHDHRH